MDTSPHTRGFADSLPPSFEHPSTRLELVSRAMGAVVALIGAVVLWGWAFDVPVLKSLHPSFISMKPNTALCFVLLGVALGLGRAASPRGHAVRAALGASIALLGAANLVEYLGKIDLGIDCLLFRDPPGAAQTTWPGRMSVPTALSFVLLGLAVPLASGARRLANVALALGAVSFALSLVALVGYGFGLTAWLGLGHKTPSALHTAAAFLLASASVVGARSDSWFAARLLSPGAGGVLLRRGVPFAILVPLGVDLVVRVGLGLRLYNPPTAGGLHAVAIIAASFWLLLVIAEKLQRGDERRQRTHEAHRASERRYRSLFEHTNGGFAYHRMVFVDGRPCDYVFLDVNAAFEKLTGLDAGATIGRRVTEVIPGFAKSGAELIEKYGEVARTGKAVEFDHFAAPLGRWYSVSAYSPEPGHFATLYVDITDRKREVDEVQRHLEVLRQVGNDVLLMLDTDGSIVQVNDRAAEAYGYTTEALLRLNIRDLRAEERVGELEDSLEGTAAGSGCRFETVHRRRDGSCFPVAVSSRSLELGGKRYLLGLIRDLTDERAARAATEKQARLLDNLFDAVVGTDASLAVNAWNRSAARIFGWTREQAAGRPISELVPESFRAQILELLELVLRGRSLERELKVRLPDRSDAWVVISARPMLGPGGAVEGTVSAIMDVSARHKAREQLLQAQKLEAVGRLASGIAHDFNNLLVVVLSNAGFLLEALPSGDVRREDAQGILDAGERAARLVHQLLTFSRKQDVRAITIEPNALVLGIEKLLQRTIGEDVEVSVALAPEPCRVRIDPGYFEQVLMNLAVNARDAMPDGGTLRIETQNLVCEAPPPGCESLPPGRYAVLKVTDSGTGISADVLPRIFEPFFTTKGVGKGTGLGLSTVYGIVDGAGGGLAVSSAPGLGTTFCVYLPTSDEAPEAAPSSLHEPAGAGACGTILLVEDDELVRRATRRMLERNGFSVVEVRSGAEALHRLRQVQVDAVLSDIVMPEVSGDVLAAAVAQAYPELPVVLMSGYTDRELSGLRVGPVLTKPFSEAALVGRLREVLEAAGGERRDSKARVAYH